MSMPGWSVPQRMPNGLVIGPLTGQMRLAGADDGGGAAVPDESVVVGPPSLDERAAASAARIRAARSALADASAWDSWISAACCAFVATRRRDFPLLAPVSLLWLESSSPLRIAACCTRAPIARASFATPARTTAVFARAAFTWCFAVATAVATFLSWLAIA